MIAIENQATFVRYYDARQFIILNSLSCHAIRIY